MWRCGGGCSTSPGLTQCVARLTRSRTIQVMLAKCGVKAGLCEKECASITVEEDATCECSCPQEARERCQASSEHQWREETCQCQCLDYQVRLGPPASLPAARTNLIIVQGRRDCQQRGHHWLTDNCTCQARHLLNIELSRTETNNTSPPPPPPPPVSITREIIVILLLSTINTCLVVVLVLLLVRLRAVKVEERGGEVEEEVDCYQVMRREEDSYLARPRLVSEKTYSDLDIYSASSGFVSESASQSEPAYETAETVGVRSKKYQLKETYQEVTGAPGDITYDRAMQAIDETLQMLKDSADKL